MPPKSKKDLTDDEKFQLQLQSEAELGRLQRQYTLLERERNEFSQTAGGKFAKQRRVLGIFQSEHNNILTDLEVATAKEKKRDDDRVNDQLTSLLDEYNYYSGKVETEKSYIREVEDQIKLVKKDVLVLRSKQVTDKQYEDRVWAGVKCIEGLENKLEVQMKKFCTICWKNRLMREEIDHLLLERQCFIKIWERLITNLNTGKKFMLDLIEQATIAYDQREEWCSKLQALRMKAHVDLVNHTQQMREFKRKQDNDQKLEAFFSVKGQKRVMSDLQEKERVKREDQREKRQELLEDYGKMIDNILEFTGETNWDVIAQKFANQEAENFMHFKYINDLIAEMEGVNDSLGFLHLQIDEDKARHEARVAQQNGTIEDLEKELQEAVRATLEEEEELKRSEANLATMMQGIATLFKICQCDNDPLLKLLGDNTTIRYYNVLLYLEILEKKVHELLLVAYHRDKVLIEKKKIKHDQRIMKEELTKPKLYHVEEVALTNPCPLCVEHEGVSDVIDTLQHVYSREDAKTKLKQRLELPDGMARLHNVSACHLPKSRQIIQKRYQ